MRTLSVMVDGRRRLALTLLVCVFAATGSCSVRDGSAGTDGRLDVVASFYPLAEIARRVGGDAVRVTDLTPSGGEPHDLELRPSDLDRLRSAVAIFFLDGGFQPALEDAIEALPDPARAVDLLRGLSLREGAALDDHGEEGEGHGGEGEDYEAEDGSGEKDPHVWLSPALVAAMADVVAGVLTERAPGEEPGFELRAEALRAELNRLDEEFRTGLRRCARREVFTAHEAFGYLTARYGLKQVAIAGVSPESEPSPRRLEEVAERARASGATTIFFETPASERVVRAVAREAGLETATLYPIESLTPAQEEAGADYFSLMRENLAALRVALGCR